MELGNGPSAPALSRASAAYRADIDGLRAIAVGAVILYHLVPSRFPMGGMGVDLFFVISGYLIGGIVLASAAEDRFSFAEFYMRRVRRIAPAFIATVLASSVAALLWLYPWELTAFAKSALASLAGGANVYFWQTADYFAPDSSSLPMLHMWSLGVEEQFYLLFPLVPVALARSRRWLTPVLVATILVSLAISVWQARYAPESAFYMLPSRWWELMAGVALTRLPQAQSGRHGSIRLAIATVGLIVVLAAFVIVKPSWDFPGMAAVPIVVGAMLVIASGRGETTLIHRALAFWPLRMVGLASYSLYLWHWPTIVFYKYAYVIGTLGVLDMVAILTLTLVLGFASWRFIEQPFRHRSVSPRRVLTWFAGGMVLAASIQVAFLALNGLPSRIPPQALAIARYGSKPKRLDSPRYNCFMSANKPARTYDSRNCLASVAGKPDWLLVGDSFAGMHWGAMVRAFPQVNIQPAVVFGCDVAVEPVPTGRTCDDLMYDILVTHLSSDRAPAAVFLTWRWQSVDEDGLVRLTRRLKARGIRLVVVGPSPSYSASVPRLLAEVVRRGDPTLTAKALRPWVTSSDAQLAALAPRAGFTYLSPLRVMCPGLDRCIISASNGRPLYFDNAHYTPEGSDLVWQRMRAAYPQLARPGSYVSKPVGVAPRHH